MDIAAENLRLLLEIGILAGARGMVEPSRTIFKGLRAIRPQNEMPVIGDAMTSMQRGQNREASQYLLEALKLNPDSDLAKSFLGLALSRLGETKHATDVLEHVVAEGVDPAATRMAKGLLESL